MGKVKNETTTTKGISLDSRPDSMSIWLYGDAKQTRSNSFLDINMEELKEDLEDFKHHLVEYDLDNFKMDINDVKNDFEEYAPYAAEEFKQELEDFKQRLIPFSSGAYSSHTDDTNTDDAGNKRKLRYRRGLFRKHPGKRENNNASEYHPEDTKGVTSESTSSDVDTFSGSKSRKGKVRRGIFRKAAACKDALLIPRICRSEANNMRNTQDVDD